MGQALKVNRGGGGLSGAFDATSGWYPNAVSSMSNLNYTLDSKYKFALVFTTSTGSGSNIMPNSRIILVDFSKQTTGIVTAGSWSAPIVTVSGHTITIDPHGSYCYASVIGIG